MGSRRLQVDNRKPLQKWTTPSTGMMKINVDGAFIPSSGIAAVGVVIRDHLGQTKLASWHLHRHCRDAEEAEAIACHEGNVLAARWPDVPMMLETDYAVVAAKLKNNGQDRSIGWSLIREARMAMDVLCGCAVRRLLRLVGAKIM